MAKLKPGARKVIRDLLIQLKEEAGIVDGMSRRMQFFVQWLAVLVVVLALIAVTLFFTRPDFRPAGARTRDIINQLFGNYVPPDCSRPLRMDGQTKKGCENFVFSNDD